MSPYRDKGYGRRRAKEYHERIKIPCPKCGKPMKPTSKTCKSCFRKPEVGSRKREHRGYVVIYQPDNPGAQASGWMYEHVFIATTVLNRPLKKGEMVHHFDGDKANNLNTNLLICTNSYHQWLEARMASLYKQKYFGGV